eukprot:COSAG05_NODE_768_length_7455_cov_4.609027_9_plen_154_part_00
MNDIDLQFGCAHYGLYGNVPEVSSIGVMKAWSSVTLDAPPIQRSCIAEEGWVKVVVVVDDTAHFLGAAVLPSARPLHHVPGTIYSNTYTSTHQRERETIRKYGRRHSEWSYLQYGDAATEVTKRSRSIGPLRIIVHQLERERVRARDSGGTVV